MNLQLGSVHLRRWITLVRTSAIPELASSFSRIHQLPQLDTINLTLAPASGPDSDSKNCLALQASILGALTDSFSIRAPSKLTSLYLKNLRTWDLTPLESSPFQTVLKNLRHLRLSVLFDRAENLITSVDRWMDFWGTLFHRLVLSPTQHTLTELSLDSSMPVGASAGQSFAGLHFPYLCALSLRNIVFEPPIGVEAFILRHGATLSRLELITCKLPIDEVSNSTHWEHIWDNFSAGLTALVALRVDKSGSDSSEHQYVSSAPGVPYWVMHVPELDVADDAALQRFYVTVAARSEERRNISSEVERGA